MVTQRRSLLVTAQRDSNMSVGLRGLIAPTGGQPERSRALPLRGLAMLRLRPLPAQHIQSAQSQLPLCVLLLRRDGSHRLRQYIPSPQRTHRSTATEAVNSTPRTQAARQRRNMNTQHHATRKQPQINTNPVWRNELNHTEHVTHLVMWAAINGCLVAFAVTERGSSTLIVAWSVGCAMWLLAAVLAFIRKATSR